jgi:signal transduction histidine kinase
VALQQKIEGMLKLTDSTISVVRRISSELRPIGLDDLGLMEAIEWQARQFQDRTGIVVTCNCGLENVSLSQEESTAVFRIFQEALTNVLRHAQATEVHIETSEEHGEFILTITDNGRGITDDEKLCQSTLGLLGMRERVYLIGGKIDITGYDGGGTVVAVRIPISR